MDIETNDTEYKRELTDGMEREVVAFMNARNGGVIYFGVADDGTSVGVKDADRVQLGSGMPRILSAYGRAAFEFGSRHVRIKMPISLEAQQVERELEAERASLVGDQKLPKGCPKDAQRI